MEPSSWRAISLRTGSAGRQYSRRTFWRCVGPVNRRLSPIEQMAKLHAMCRALILFMPRRQAAAARRAAFALARE